MNQPPSDINLEKSILGGILLDNKVMDKVSGSLEPEHFYKPAHGQVFKAMEGLYRDNETIDVLTLINRLRASKELASAGGEVFVMELHEGFIASGNVQEHAKIVKEKAARRSLILHHTRIVQKCYDEAAAMPEVIKESEAGLERITRGLYAHKEGKLCRALDFTGKIGELYQNGKPTGVSTGWEALDPLMTVNKRTLNVVTGYPGAGKSEFMDALFMNLAENQNWKFAVYSPENFPAEVHVQKLIEKKAGKPFYKDLKDRMSLQDLNNALNWIDQHFAFIELPEESTDLMTLLAVINKIKDRIDGYVIDPFNELEAWRPYDVSMTDWINRWLTVIRRFNRKNDLAGFIVAHPTKVPKDKKTGEYPVPTLYDISGSAHWRNKADVGIVVDRDPKDTSGEVRIHIQKMRYKYHGRVGMAKLYYDRPSGRYLSKQPLEDF